MWIRRSLIDNDPVKISKPFNVPLITFWTQTLMQKAVVVDCDPLQDRQIPAWIGQEAASLGISVREDAVQALKESAGSLYALRRELEKLAAYVPAGRAVTVEDVQALRGTEPGASVFDLTMAIGAGARGRALTILARNLEAGEARGTRR